MSFYLLLAATILFFAFTRTEAGRAELLRQAEQQFASRFDGSLEIGSIHGNVVYSLLARDVVIKAPNGSTVASIDSIRARPTWSGLLRRTLDFDRLDIVGADVFLERGPSGAWNIEEALTPRRYSLDSTAIVPSVILPRLAISRATINIENDADVDEAADGYFFDYLNSAYSIREALVAADWSEGSLQVDVIRFAGAVLDPSRVLADLPVTDATGQLIFDRQGVRLNELRVETQQSELQVVGTIDFDPAVRTLRRSQIDARIFAERVHPADLSRLFPHQPLRVPTSVRLHATGSPTDFVVHEAAVEYGRSRLVMSGVVSASTDSVTFDVGLNTPYLSLADLQTATPGPLADRLAPLDTLSGDIWAQGDFPLGGSTLESFDADVQTELQTGAGGVSASGWIRRRFSDASYQLNLSVADMDARLISGGALQSSQLTGSMFVASSSVDATKASGLLQLELYDSVYGTVSIDSLSANVRATEGRYDGTARLFQAGEELTGALASDFDFGLTEGQRFLNVDMVASDLDVGDFVRGDALQTQLDGRAEIHLTGRPEAPEGTAVVEVNGGVVRQRDFEVELGASRSELLLTHAGEGFRSELKGDLVNASLEATISPKTLIEAIPDWSRHAISSIEQLGPRPYPLEDLLDAPSTLALTEEADARVRTAVAVTNDSVLVSLLLRRHVQMRDFSGAMDLVSDSTGLSASVELDGLSVATGPYELTRPTATMSLFVPGAGDPAEVQAEANLIAASAAKGGSRTLNPEVDVTLSQGVVKGFVGADRGASLGPVDVALTATFGGGIWNASFDRLRFEGAGYDVSTVGRHTIRLYRNAVSTRGLALVSPDADGGVQRLTVRGTYSGRDVDTLSVDASSIDLQSLSSLLDFSTRLSGSVDGTIEIARSANSPIIAGNGTISGLGLDQRVLGDLRVESQFLGSRDEVAVSAHLSPLSVADTSANNVVENDLSLEGGIRFGGTSSGRAEMDLRADIRRADLFFFEYIFPHTIDGVVGQVRGTGRIRGTFARPHFDAQLDLADARFTVPEFNLAFTAEGQLVVDRDAIQIVSATIGDTGGGSALLSGYIEFNDYRFFSLNLAGDLDRLQIMNIAHSRDLPFYGDIRGSGHVTLDGPLYGATLRATNAQTTAASEVYIPIVEPIDVSDQSFIVFADSTGRLGDAARDQRANVLDRRPPGERSFLDGLALDLNIFAPPGSTVNLVIDPLLGDVINAVGSGRVQIRREEGVFSTFGSLEVNSGDYLFTAGDVFVRRFLIDSGGTITWDGDPTNAILDIPASYKTRASRAGLPGSEGTGSTIPLIVRLRITGRVATPQVDLSLEVDRTNRDVSGNYAALEAILNQPSRSTEYATSVLVTNSFLLTTSEANADVLASSAFNSVSHLVASHINRYLNEALPNVDFSFGVQGESAQELGVTYGIALRLLDERLVIRGQGIYQGHDDASAAGSQQNLEGEFVVEVRLNPTVSVEVFYRREGDVLTSSSTLTGSTGAGVTYRTEFSTWRRFFSRIFGTRDS